MEIIESNLSFNAMDTRKSTERIILHHADASSCSAEDIHRWHLNKGWSGAGYHFLVRKDGAIYRLRPEDKVGAHAYGSNYNSIGICFEGRYMEEDMSEAQKQAGKELVAYIKNKYNINTVQAHRDVNATSCPGDKFPFDEIANFESNNVEETKPDTPQINENENKDIFNDGLVNCIYDIQEWLRNKYGYNIGLDNIYGPETKKYLIMALQHELNVQFNRGLAEDGIWGPKTKNACINVRQGASGNITMLIQMALFIKGYNIDMDKKFGNNTAIIVGQFQKDNGLTSDGIVGKNTFKKLFE